MQEPNENKRKKEFEKLRFIYIDNPYFNKVKFLYSNGIYTSLPQAKNVLNKIKFKKDGTPHQSSNKYIKEINDLYNSHFAPIDERNIIIDRSLVIDLPIEEQYNWITHQIEFQRIRRNNKKKLYRQVIKFYNDRGLYKGRGFKTIEMQLEDDGTQKKVKNFYKNIRDKVIVSNRDLFIDSLVTEDYSWIVKMWVEESPNTNYATITTQAIDPIKTRNKRKIKQVYRDNDNGTCVYDAVLKYFENKKEKGDRNAKAIYNRLYKNTELKKSYTDDSLIEICDFTNSSIKICDLVKGDDKITQSSLARFRIELCNTKYNHLDLLLTNNDKAENASDEELENIKNDSDFYVEKFGKLYTLNGVYCKKITEFKQLYMDWLKKNDMEKLSISCNDEVNEILSSYDYSMHRFFKTDMTIDNKLYKELDGHKNYLMYADKKYNKLYNGVPSGSFICHKINNFSLEQFYKQYQNDLIGFYSVEIKNIISHHNHFNDILGFKIGTVHTLTSDIIYNLIPYIEFKFLYYAISPKCHVPFDDTFDCWFDVDGNKTEKYEKGCVRGYCKLFGLLHSMDNIIKIKIKPLKCDMNYCNLINNENYNVYKFDNILNISFMDLETKNHNHIAYYIHSYTKLNLMMEMLKINVNDIYGVKSDSIVLNKNVKFDYNKPYFKDKYKPAKIETMMQLHEKDECLMEYGLNWLSIYNYYFEQTTADFSYKLSFLPDHEPVVERVIVMTGKGGAGKTHSIMTNLKNKYITYTTNCWNLMVGKKNEFKDITIKSIPNWTGKIRGTGQKTEIVENANSRYDVFDEGTLLDVRDLKQCIKKSKYNFIFIIGDIDGDKYYQCSIPDVQVIKESDIKCQVVKYIKNYRFDNDLNNLLDNLRIKMDDENISNTQLLEYVKSQIPNNFKSIENVIYNDDDVGISSHQDQCIGYGATSYFLDKGVKPKYIIDQTYRLRGQLRGQQLDNRPTHSNYEIKLFKTIHSFQGLQTNHDNKIIIIMGNIFDRNLPYTALSRARRIDQLVIIDKPYTGYQ